MALTKKDLSLLDIYSRVEGISLSTLKKQLGKMKPAEKNQQILIFRKKLLKAKRGKKIAGHTQKELEKDSRNWFRNILKNAKGIGATKVRRGYFYYFTYKSYDYPDPLAYYDTKPLIYLLDIKRGGGKTYMLGINFHWLSRSGRIKLLSKMIKNDVVRFEKDLPLSLRYPTVKSNTHAYSIVRRYIKSNIKKKIVRVPNIEMPNVVNLRSEKFVGITPEMAFKLSKKKSQKGKEKKEKKSKKK